MKNLKTQVNYKSILFPSPHYVLPAYKLTLKEAFNFSIPDIDGSSFYAVPYKEYFLVDDSGVEKLIFFSSRLKGRSTFNVEYPLDQPSVPDNITFRNFSYLIAYKEDVDFPDFCLKDKERLFNSVSIKDSIPSICKVTNGRPLLILGISRAYLNLLKKGYFPIYLVDSEKDLNKESSNSLFYSLVSLLQVEDSLFTDNVIKNEDSSQELKNLVPIPTSSINIKSQPRKYFSDNFVSSLARSMSEVGLIQPIVVSKTGSSSYILINGESRLKAAILLGWKYIPAVIKDLPDDDRLLLSQLHENIYRANLSPLEKAFAYANYFNFISSSKPYNEAVEKASSDLGIGKRSLQNYIRMSKEDPRVLNAAPTKLSPTFIELLSNYPLTERIILAKDIEKGSLTLSKLRSMTGKNPKPEKELLSFLLGFIEKHSLNSDSLHSLFDSVYTSIKNKKVG